MERERYRRGWEILKELDPKVSDQVVANLSDIAPEFAKYMIEFPFGDLYSRPELVLRQCSYEI
jgi:4-carboxymuconolactone decarboxylase